MRQLPFDSGNFFVPACERWKQEALNDQGSEYLGDMLRIRTLVQDGRSPQAILRFFGLPDHGHPDRLFDMVGDVQLQVFTEMLALTGEEYRIDWSRRDGSFCLWYRDRDHRRDATRDLLFVRANTKVLSTGAEIRNSPVHGFGLFAVKNWYINDVLVESLGGQVLSHDEYELLQARLAPGLGRMRRFFFMEWNALPGDRLLARPFRTQYSYINHSTDPNVRIEPLLCGGLSLVISRDIEPEGEFFLDYRLEPLPRGYFESPYSGYLVPASVR